TRMLEGPDDGELVLGEDLGEALGCFESGLRLQLPVLVEDLTCDHDLRPEVQLPGRLPGNGNVVSRDHTDVEPEGPRGLNGRRRVVAGRVEQREQPEQLPAGATISCNSEHAVAGGGERVDVPGDLLSQAVVRLHQPQDGLRSALADLPRFVAPPDLRVSAL